MIIKKVETLHCDAGWRPWSFIKITTDKGLIGWSECTDSHGSPLGIEGVVKDLSVLLIGQDPRLVAQLVWQMQSRTRQSPGSIIQKAIGGIENALLDIKAKAIGVPVYELFSGPVRTQIPVYWSHCGTSRVRAWKLIGKNQIKDFSDLKKFGKEFKDSGFKALKTNIAILDENPRIYMPGFFKSEGGPELNADRPLLENIDKWVSGFRKAVGDDVEIILDLNFNFKTEGYLKVGRMLEKYNLMWLEIDSYDPEALLQIKQGLKTPICSGENLYGARQYRPYLENHTMDVASIDVIWNGLTESKKIADLADTHEINVTSHNYNGHLSTFISAHWAALVPNLRIMELDVDDVPWRDELFTNKPVVKNGILELPKGPGWGTEVNEKVLRAHPWPKK